MNVKNHKVVIVKHSCITGRIVWVYFGKSEEAARKAYWRACKKEVRRVRNWGNHIAERRQQFMHLITMSNSSSSINSLMADLTPQQRKAARTIINMSKQPPAQDREFYDHIIEEARRRNFRSERWRENREKLFRYGKTHTKWEYQPKGASHDGRRKKHNN